MVILCRSCSLDRTLISQLLRNVRNEDVLLEALHLES